MKLYHKLRFKSEKAPCLISKLGWEFSSSLNLLLPHWSNHSMAPFFFSSNLASPLQVKDPEHGSVPFLDKSWWSKIIYKVLRECLERVITRAMCKLFHMRIRAWLAHFFSTLFMINFSINCIKKIKKIYMLLVDGNEKMQRVMKLFTQMWTEKMHTMLSSTSLNSYLPN